MLVKIKQAGKNKDNFYFKTVNDRTQFKLTVPNEYLNPCWKAWDYLIGNGWFHDGYWNDGKHTKDVVIGSSNFLVWKKPENDAEELELLLKNHDWSYEYSDAHNTYARGEKERDRIKRLMKKIGNPQAVEIYKKFCPSVSDWGWGLRLMGVEE